MSNFEDMKIHIEKNLHFPRQSSFNFTLKFIKLSTLVKMFKIKKKNASQNVCDQDVHRWLLRMELMYL